MTPILILTIILASRFVTWDKLKGIDTVAAEHLTYGTQLLRKGKTYKAIAYLTQAIEIEPKYAEAYINRGRAYYHLAHYEEAISDYTKTLSLKQYAADAYASRGDVYRALDNVPRAIADYTASLEKSKNALIMTKRAKCYLETGNINEAITDYSYIVKHRPTAIAYYNRGKAYQKKSLLSENKSELLKLALSDFDNAIKMQPHFAIAYLNRSEIYGDLGQQNLVQSDYTKAIELLTEAIQNWRNDKLSLIPIYLWRVVAYKKKNQIDKTQNDINKIYELFTQFYLKKIRISDILFE